MLQRHLIEGGIHFMLPIYIMWIANIGLCCYMAFRLVREGIAATGKLKRLSEVVFFFGSLAFLWGMLGLLMGLGQILDVIREMSGQLSLAMIAGGFRVALIAPLYGFVLLIASFIVWYALRWLRR